MSAFYPYIITALLLSVVWWFYRNAKEQSKILPALSFWASSVLYAMVLFITDFGFYYKLLLMLPRDLIALVMVLVLANNLKTTRGFLMLSVGVGFGSYLLYSRFVPDTYQKWIAQEYAENEPDLTTLEGLAPEGELLVDVKNPALVFQLTEMLAPFKVKVKPAFPELQSKDITALDDCFLIDIPKEYFPELAKIISLLEESGAVDWVERNEVVQLSPLERQPATDKPIEGIDYGVNDPNLDRMWGFEKMQVAEYFKYIKTDNIRPKKKAKIAILDTGVDSKHEDLKGNFVSTKKSYDSDKQSHGTHCAGIAASVTNNGLGVASLAMNGEFVQVTSVKVLSDYGWGTQDGIIRGIIEAADKGADIISLSLGGPSNDASQRAYEQAIAYANQKGAIIVVAAGNESQNAKKVVPASCKGVITVSAVNSNLDKASFSNFVTDLEMGIAAPGEDILSTIPKNKYAAYSGTSMATPYVAGLLGILKSLKPDLTTKQAYKILKDTGKETKAVRETGKFINPLGAVRSLK
jgi:thermitase